MAWLLECSICLDRFTEPRMLPCQHTFCLQCLENVVGDDRVTVIKCPQCRARHTLPPGRVQGLPGNLVINNLLSSLVESPTASAKNPECADCEEQGPVSLCNHCQEHVCVECRVLHDRLSRDVQQTLDQLREWLTPPGGSTEQLAASLRAVKLERERMNAAVQELADSLLQALETRQAQLDAIFQTLVGVHEDLLQPAGRKPLLENFSRQAARSKNIQSLRQLKESLEEIKTFARLAGQQAAEVQFRSQSQEMYFENWGSVHVGDTVVEITSEMKNLTSTGSVLTSGQNSSVNQSPAFRTAQSPSGIVRPDSQPRLTRGQNLHRRNTLPRNVNYRGKGGTVSVIGPELRLGDGERKLKYPINCVYNAQTEELLVCDNGNNRVLAMKTDANSPRVLYKNNTPWDIAISDDGQNVFILSISPFEIHHVTIRGCFVQSSDICQDDRSDKSYSLVYHDQQLAVVLQNRKSVVLFNMSLERTRTFRVEAVREPHSMTVDSDGNFYITDRQSGAVHVYTWGGQHTRAFGAVSELAYLPGICVDGDGVVCVTRFWKNRVDVYDCRSGGEKEVLLESLICLTGCIYSQMAG